MQEDPVLNRYLIVDQSVLPDYFLKVIEARKLLESGTYTQVSDAARAVGISRSTYYKYKDKVMEPSQVAVGRTATLMLTLSHESGVLSKVLNRVSACGANILTLSQCLPVHDQASLMLSVDISGMNTSLEELTRTLEQTGGVEKVRLAALE